MNRILTAAILFIGAGLYSCGGGKPARDESAAIKSEIAAMIAAYCADVKADGLTAEFKHLDSTREFRWRPPGFDTYINYDSVATILRKNAPALKSVVNSYDSLIITPIDNDHATYTALVRSRIVDSGGKISRMTLSESGSVVRRSGGWKLLSGETRILHY